jgi:homoserine dehydrogenase
MTHASLASQAADPFSDGSLDAYRTSGASPTLHLLGAGSVGRALLRILPPSPLRLVALSDSTATVYDQRGLDALALAAFKGEGRELARRAGAQSLPADLALSLVAADVVVDCTATRPDQAGDSLRRSLAALDRGSRLVLAAKNALLADPLAFLEGLRRARLGANGVLGGTGASLLRELDELRLRCRAIACVANATTGCLIDAIERGHDLEGALAQARARGFCEADAGLDLDGTDAAIKLVIVASWLSGTRRELREVERPDLRALDLAELRSRAARGATTRLVGRLLPGGALRLAYEELPRASSLAVPTGRVVYSYDLGGGVRRLHLGAGIGPQGTARALFDDVVELCATRRAA